MNKNIILAVAALLLLPSVMITSVSGGDPIVVTSGKTIYVDDSGGKDYTSIQSAINAANPGDTVYVYNGTYHEIIVINRTINLIGENKITTIINGSGYGNVVNISADHINISGFTIQNSKIYGIGITIQSNYNSITNNIINNNNRDGMGFIYSSNNTISGNTINNNDNGIIFFYSSNNTISGNTINNSVGNGLYFECYSNNNTISGNTIINNRDGIIFFISCSNNTISGNTIKNNYIGIESYYSSNNNVISDNTIINNKDTGICFYSSSNNTISGNTIKSSAKDSGIYFSGSSNNVISGNNISNNNYAGIYFWYSNNNTISDNTISKNGYYGIHLHCSTKNTIYHNNLINNTQNAWDTWDTKNNSWYNTTLKEGNYWDNYTGIDSDGNGIGDTPYDIPNGGNKDHYPLMKPYTKQLEVKIIRGINQGVFIDIKNVGKYYSAVDINYNISVVGGVLGLINSTTEGIIPLIRAGDNITVNLTVFGLGIIKIDVTIDGTNIETEYGLIFGRFVLIPKFFEIKPRP